MEKLRTELIEFIKLRSKINSDKLLGLILANDTMDTLVEYLEGAYLSVFTNDDGVNVIIMLTEKYIPLLGLLLDSSKKYLVITPVSATFSNTLIKYENITHISLSGLTGKCILPISSILDELNVVQHGDYTYDIITNKLDDKYDNLSILSSNDNDTICKLGSPRFELTIKKQVITDSVTNDDDVLVPYGINDALRKYLITDVIEPVKYKKLSELSITELNELIGLETIGGLTISKLRSFWNYANIDLLTLSQFMDIAEKRLEKIKKEIKPINIFNYIIKDNKVLVITSNMNITVLDDIKAIHDNNIKLNFIEVLFITDNNNGIDKIKLLNIQKELCKIFKHGHTNMLSIKHLSELKTNYILDTRYFDINIDSLSVIRPTSLSLLTNSNTFNSTREYDTTILLYNDKKLCDYIFYIKYKGDEVKGGLN